MNRKEFIKGMGIVAGATAFGSRVLGSGRAAMSVSTLGFGCAFARGKRTR